MSGSIAYHRVRTGIRSSAAGAARRHRPAGRNELMQRLDGVVAVRLSDEVGSSARPMAARPTAGTVRPMTASEAIDREGEADPGGRPGGWAWRTLVLDLAPVAVLALLTLAAEERPGRHPADTHRGRPAARRPSSLAAARPGRRRARRRPVQHRHASEPWVAGRGDRARELHIRRAGIGPNRDRRWRSSLVAGLDDAWASSPPTPIPSRRPSSRSSSLVPSWLIGDIVRTRRVESARRSEAIERSAARARGAAPCGRGRGAAPRRPRAPRRRRPRRERDGHPGRRRPTGHAILASRGGRGIARRRSRPAARR